METFFCAGDFKFDSDQGFACKCCVDFVWCFTAIYSQEFLPKNHVQDWSFVAFRLQSRFREKIKIFCQIYRADNVEVKTFFLNSYTYRYCKRSQSISDRNSSIDFFYSDFHKRQNARMYKWLCSPSRVCRVASKHSNWWERGKLWSLFLKTLDFD